MWKSLERLSINSCPHLNNIMDFTLLLVIATLLSGIFSLVKSIDGFLKSGSQIINISSLGGIPYTKKIIGLSAYSSSKAAVTVLTECFAEEFKQRGVLCNCFALGAVKTDMLKKAFPSFKGGESVDFVAKEIVDFSISKDKLLTGKIINLASSF